jgi:diadenosine tetraphosphate (Ap4A) HIT family hydrolase
MSCLFCQIPPERLLAQNQYAFAIRDAFPVTPAHTLIIPKRHIASFFETSAEEKTALLQLLDEIKAGIDGEHQPDSYNIGINDGAAAGQTISHLHIHLIPRYQGDVEDPRGSTVGSTGDGELLGRYSIDARAFLLYFNQRVTSGS